MPAFAVWAMRGLDYHFKYSGCLPHWMTFKSGLAVGFLSDTNQSISQFNSNLAAREPDNTLIAVLRTVLTWYFSVLRLVVLCLNECMCRQTFSPSF